MKFLLFDAVFIEIESPGGAVDVYLARELGYFRLSGKGVVDAPTVRVRYDAALTARQLRADAAVGDALFKAGGDYFVADTALNLAEWVIPSGARREVVVRVHPAFNPYRFYFYVLLPLVKFWLNQRGLTFLHASSVAEGGRAFVLSGWGGTGKTNTLLALLEEGATYLGDDLSVIDREGHVHPFPRSVSVFDYNLAAFPRLAQHIGIGKRIQMAVVRALFPIAERLLPSFAGPINVARKMLSNVTLSPQVLSVRQPEGRLPAGLVAILYRGERAREPELMDADAAVCAACANLAYEFSGIARIGMMYSFLSGSPSPDVVGRCDEDIIRAFLGHALPRVVHVDARGVSVEGLRRAVAFDAT
jgi:hypothetical protein